MTERTGDPVVRVVAALGKSAAYLALFLGFQTVTVMVYMIALAVRLMTDGMTDEAALSAALLERTTAATAPLTLVSGLLTLAVVALVYRIRKKPLREAVWLRPVEGHTLLAGAALAPAMYFLVTIALASLPEEWLQDYSEASSSLADISVTAFVAVVLVAPLVEEVIFRGLIMTRLAGAMPGWLAVLLSAAIFGACHGQFVWFCYTFALGALFGFMDLRSGSILPSVLGHVAFNLIGQIFSILNTLWPEGEWAVPVVLGLLLLAGLLPVLDRRGVAAVFFGRRPAPDGAAVPVPQVQAAPAPAGTGTFSWKDETVECDPWAD